MHLSDLELVDLAEGTRPESSAPHLATCDRCRGELLEMRRMMSAAADVPVPEPSPLFWDHFSRRVHDAVAAEAAAPRRWWDGFAAFRHAVIPAAAVALIALLVAGVVTSRGPRTTVALVDGLPSSIVAIDLDDAVVDDDPLTLIADLSAAIDVDPSADAALGPSAGADHALTSLDSDELRDLQQLLQDLSPSGA